MKKIRWGILGAARVNERLLPAIANSPFGDLVAIGSRRANAAEECLEKYQPNLKGKVKTFNSLDEVICDSDIDVIYIPLSNEEHAEPALKAINNKKHVLIEKPITLYSKEVQAIQEAANKNHVKVMEGFMYVFHPQFDRVNGEWWWCALGYWALCGSYDQAMLQPKSPINCHKKPPQ